MQLYISWYIRSFFGITFLNILYFFKYSCTNIFHRRSLYTFYGIVYRRICVLRGPTELMAVRLCLEDKHCSNNMMTSSNGNISRVTGHLCGEFTGHRWISRSKASDAELWFFLSSELPTAWSGCSRLCCLCQFLLYHFFDLFSHCIGLFHWNRDNHMISSDTLE